MVMVTKPLLHYARKGCKTVFPTFKQWLMRQQPAIAGAGLVLMVGCIAPFYQYHGYVPKESELAALIINVDTKDTVEETIGLPQGTGLIEETVWYYSASRWENRGYNKTRPVDRTIVAIHFDENDTVYNIETFRLADGKIIPLTRRITRTTANDTSLLREMFKNFGNINLEQFR